MFFLPTLWFLSKRFASMFPQTTNTEESLHERAHNRIETSSWPFTKPGEAAAGRRSAKLPSVSRWTGMDLEFFCFPECPSPLSVIYQPLATVLAEPDRGDLQRHREGIGRRVGTGRRGPPLPVFSRPLPSPVGSLGNHAITLSPQWGQGDEMREVK